MKKILLLITVLQLGFLSACDELTSLLDDQDEILLGEGELALNNQNTGTIASDETLDFEFEISEEVEVAIFIYSTFDSYGELFDSEGVLLNESDDSFLGLDFFIRETLQPGTYKITVSGLSEEEYGSFTILLYDMDSLDLDSETLSEGIEKSDSIDIDEYVYYEVTITESGTYEFYSTGDIDTVGILYDDYSALVDLNDDKDFLDSNFYIKTNLEPGTYYIFMAVYDGDAVGPFSIVYNQVIVEDTSEYPVLELGSYVSGVLEAGSGYTYEFTITTAGYYTVYANTEFDSYGILQDEDLNFIDEDDDDAGDLDFGMEVYLYPGTYYLDLMGFDTSDSGLYYIYLEEGQVLPEPTTRNAVITLDTTETDTLQPGETVIYEFVIPSEGDYTIQLVSDFDSFGVLYNVNDVEIANDDDSGQGLDFGMEMHLVGGTYYLHVSGLSSTDHGNYTLYLESGWKLDNTVNTPDDIMPGDSVYSYLEAGDMAWYQFTLPYGQYIDIYVESSFDSYGYITDYDGYVLFEDDDSAGYLDFKLYAWLDAGTYFVIVTGLSAESDFGDYTLYFSE